MPDFMTVFNNLSLTQMAKFFNDVEMGDVSGAGAAPCRGPY